jgi:hypothetical protein
MGEEKELAQVDVDLKMKMKLAEAEKRNQAREESLLKVRARIGFARYLEVCPKLREKLGKPCPAPASLCPLGLLDLALSGLLTTTEW